MRLLLNFGKIGEIGKIVLTSVVGGGRNEYFDDVPTMSAG